MQYQLSSWGEDPCELGLNQQSVRVKCLAKSPIAKMRLFCFPYAGASVSIFRLWPSYLPKFLEVYSVELPGRDSLIRQLPFTKMSCLVQGLTLAMGPYLDVPFALFGHSMGSLISFELAR